MPPIVIKDKETGKKTGIELLERDEHIRKKQKKEKSFLKYNPK